MARTAEDAGLSHRSVELRPIIVIKEGANGLGLQLRLVAGPLRDAGAAAKICAVLSENKRRCETTIFDGQRLTIKDEAPSAAAGLPCRQTRAAPAQACPGVAAAPPPLAEEAPKQAGKHDVLVPVRPEERQ